MNARRTAGLSLMAAMAAIVAAWLLADSRADAQQPRRNMSFDEAREAYQDSLDRPSLFIRARYMRRLASTRDPRALNMLISRYDRPEAPQDHVRFLSAAIACKAFNSAQHLEAIAGWLDDQDNNANAWLWFWGQQVRARHGQLAEVLEMARESRDVFLQAASIEALSAMQHEALFDVVPSAIEEAPRRGVEREVVVRACAGAVLALKAYAGESRFRTLALAVIGQLGEDSDVSETTQLVIARHLKATFETDGLSLDPQQWLQLLDGAAVDPSSPYARPRFLGVEANGKRIAYVIDLSDSMLQPLSVEDRNQLRAVITGREGADPAPRNPGQAAQPLPELPWDEITNRFEAAREFLKLSLSELPDDLEFVIITLGNDAKLLSGMQGLMRATDRNKRRVVQALDAIRPGPPAPRRPNGTLEGFTNLHGGICRAFQVRGSRGVVETNEHIDEDCFEDGVDTIFVLSDGAPSWDDFVAVDRRDPEDQAGDPESGTMAQNVPQLQYYGPYVQWNHPHLVDDIRRMNMFRKVEIHCIGIGEAEPVLLQAICDIGLGKLQRIQSNR